MPDMLWSKIIWLRLPGLLETMERRYAVRVVNPVSAKLRTVIDATTIEIKSIARQLNLMALESNYKVPWKSSKDSRFFQYNTIIFCYISDYQ